MLRNDIFSKIEVICVMDKICHMEVMRIKYRNIGEIEERTEIKR